MTTCLGNVRKAGVAALTLGLLTGHAWAGVGCAQPQDMTALQIAALQQQLMVTALTCNDAATYNRFVISNRSELQVSDRALMRFFVRQDAVKGADRYNAYKTELANASSLRSVRDPRFCRSAKIAFNEAFEHGGSLAELVSQRSSLIKTGYVSCAPEAGETTQMADATPSLQTRHKVSADGQSSDLVPGSTSQLDRALPPPRRAVAPRRGHTDDSRDAQRTSPDRDAEDRDADAQDGDDRDVDAVDHYRALRQYVPEVNDDAPSYDPEYADATPTRSDDRNGDRYNRGNRYSYGRGDSASDDGYDDRRAANDTRGDDRDGYDDRQAANDAPGDDAYDGRYRSSADRPFPPRARIVRGPDGLWYLLRHRR